MGNACCLQLEQFLDTLARIAAASGVVYDPELVTKAWEYAESCHHEQKRLSGEAYISHPSETALIIASMGMDQTSIIAALLHDTVEDSDIANPETIQRNFGADVIGTNKHWFYFCC